MKKILILFAVILAICSISASAVVINEFLPNPGTIDWDANSIISETDDEWVEVYNNGTSAVNISGWTIADAVGTRYTFPQDSFIEAGEFITIYGTLGLNNGGDMARLRDSLNNIVDSITYLYDPGNDVSIGRDTDGGLSIVNWTYPTPNAENGNCTVPHEGTYVVRDTIVCAGSYNISYDVGSPGYPLFTMETSEVILDCNGAIISSFRGSFIRAYNADNIAVKDCIIDDLSVSLTNVNNSLIANNTFINNGRISLMDSSNNIIVNNSFEMADNFEMHSYVEEGYNNSIDSSNTINGKPILYYYDMTGLVLDGITGFGKLMVAYSDNVVIKNINFNESFPSIDYCDNLAYENNSFYNTTIEVYFSDNPLFSGNSMENSFIIWGANNNSLFKENTFIGESVVLFGGSNNTQFIGPTEIQYLAFGEVNSNNNYIKNVNVTKELQIGSYSSVVVEDSYLENIDLRSSTLVLINTTYATSHISGDSANITVQYKTGIHVEDKYNNPVTGATVTATDGFGNYGGSAITDANGDAVLNLTSYVINETDTIDYNNYIINATDNGNSESIVITVDDNSNYEITITPTNSVPPVFSNLTILNQNQRGYVAPNANILGSATVTDDGFVEGVICILNNTAGTIYNTSSTIKVGDNYTCDNLQADVQDDFQLFFQATDNRNLTGISEPINFTTKSNTSVMLSVDDVTVTGLTQEDIENILVSAYLTNNGNNTVYNPTVILESAGNVAVPQSTAVACNQTSLGSSETCTAVFNLTIIGGTAPGDYFPSWDANWTDNSLTEQRLEAQVESTITIDPTYVMEVQDTVSIALIQGSSMAVNVPINSSGNADLGNLNIIYAPGTLPSDWVTISQYSSTIAAGSSTSFNITVNVPGSVSQGNYTGQIIVTADGVPQKNIQVNLANFQNHAPVLNPIGDKQVNEGSGLQFTINAQDADIGQGDVLTFSSNKTGISVNKIGPLAAEVTWIPSDADVGNHSVEFKVTDLNGSSDSKTINIKVNGINYAPVIESYQPNFNPKITEDGSQAFLITASDRDVDELVAQWFLDGVYQLNGDSYTFNANQAGVHTYNVTVVVSDGTVDVSRSWTLTTSDVPITSQYTGTISQFNSQQVANASPVTIQNAYGRIDFGNQGIDLSNIVDVDRYINIASGIIGIDTNNFPSLRKPALITLYGLTHTETPVIYYNQGFQLSGSQVCPSTVCSNITYDGSTLSFYADHFTIFWVTSATTNYAPEITSSPVIGAKVNTAYNYQVTATDPDYDTITFSLAANPPGMNINPTTGLIDWIPSVIGNYSVVVAASDGISNTTQSYTLYVTETGYIPGQSMLAITDLDIKVDGESDKNLENGDTIGEEAKPLSEIEFSVKVDSLFTDKTDIDDVVVTIQIKDIDEGDDLEEESDEFNLDNGDDNKVTLNFKLPILVEEDTYEVIIRAEGEDENGEDHEVEWSIYLEVDKESHDIMIYDTRITPSTVTCTGYASLDLEVVNIGSKDEDDVTIQIKNSQLGINLEYKDIELESGSDEDSTYDKRLQINVPDNTGVGTYPIDIKVYRDGNDLIASETVDLNVGACTQIQQKEDKVDVNVVSQAEASQLFTFPSTSVQTKASKISFKESDEYLMVLTIGTVIALGLVVYGIGAVLILSKK